MARKKKHEEHVNLERWLVSYADFITLLFATFVILYALSQIDLAKFKDLKISLQKAFTKNPTILEGDAGMLSSNGQSVMDSGGMMDSQNMVPPILDAIAAKEEESNFQLTQDKLKEEKGDKGNKGPDSDGIKTRVTERGLVINLVGNIFFKPSDSVITKESFENLKEIGLILKEKFPYNLIRVEGHTDNQPMRSSAYPSNWELSSARAASIVRYFTDEIGIAKDRFVVVGYGDTRPVATNETENGRNANRRVEIVVLRSKFIKSELQTYSFQKERVERLKKIEQILKEEENKNKKDSNISDAAKKLMDESKGNSNRVIQYKQDEKTAETKELEEKLKNYEQETDPKVKRKLFFKSVQKELKHD